MMAAALLVGCGTDEAPAPTCETAVPAYYAAGCEHVSGERSVPEAEMTKLCVDLSPDFEALCAPQIEAWLTCYEAAAVGGCDCAAELDAVIRC